MVGSTFAFFAMGIQRDGETDTEYSATTATVTATYTETSNISITNITPGTEAGSKEIAITNTSEVPIEYEIVFDTYTNEFANLQYKLEGITAGTQNSSSTANIQGLTASIEQNEEGFVTMGATDLHDSSKKLVTGHLEPEEVHKFTLTMKLKDTGANQNDDDGGKTFTGKLQASAKAVKPTETP